MYVLHHADQPQLYHGLPKNPKIDEAVALWKGWFKPFSLAGIALTAVVAFVHYITAGPNETSDEDQKNAEQLAGRGQP